MGEDEALEERLKSHGRAFEGLMSLIPAKYYYEQDNSTQWQKKKQTKEEKRAARKAKLDPKNIKTAKDVMDENERKRKRELGEDDDDEIGSPIEGVMQETPREGLKTSTKQQNKKQKLNSTGAKVNGEAVDSQHKVDKRKEKRLQQKEERKQEKEKDKVKAKTRRDKVKQLKRAAKEGKESFESGIPIVDGGDVAEGDELEDEPADDQPKLTVDADNSEEEIVINNDMDKMDVSNLDDQSSEASQDQDSTFSQPSVNASSRSSLDTKDSESEPTIPTKKSMSTEQKESHAEIRARLQAKIESMRLARKAVTEEGQPVRSRAELIESRRKKEEARKKHKKELRQQQRESEQQVKAEAELARLRGSGSPIMASPLFTPPLSTDSLPNFSFGRVSFEDGELLDATGKVQTIKKKGAIDAKSALTAAERKAERLKNMPEAQRADLESKELWLNAKKRAHGERVRDDVSLLKKALKRKEKQKSKSEKEWKAREEGIKKGQEIRQRKREDNLAKRRDDKGGKKGKKKGGGMSEKQKQKRAKKKVFG